MKIRPTAPALALVLALATLLPGTLQGQGVALLVRGGTPGVGGDLSVSLGSWLAIRAGAAQIPIDLTTDREGIEYNLKLPSPTLHLLVDFFPGGSGLRLTGGYVRLSGEFSLEGALAEAQEIGGQTYQPGEIGTLRAEVDPARKLAPYAGIGLGGNPSGGFGLVLDVGVALWGEPSLSLSADGLLGQDPEFRSDLLQEEAELQATIREDFRFFPMVSIGVKFPLSRLFD